MARRKNATNTKQPENYGHLTESELNAIDRAVGGQVRYRRILLGLSQQAVSATLGLTFQQLQKYEHGTNRISGSRLHQLSIILQVPVSFFFETVEPSLTAQPHDKPAPADAMPSGLMNKRRTIELISVFYAIASPQDRDAAFKLIAAMSKGSKAHD